MSRLRIGPRIRPEVVKTLRSPNQSLRSSPIRLIVLHSTESHDRPGSSDRDGVASWLCNPSAQASAHVIVDGDGVSVRLVADEAKAWACVSFNSPSLNIEQIGFAADSAQTWRARWRELRETARWIALWSRRHDIPIRRSTYHGVCRHMDLGPAGGGHTDPGPNYPIGRVMALARLYRAALRVRRVR